MYPVRITCPICDEQMLVTKLECHNCNSELSGTFELPLLLRLNPAQMHFVEVMVKHRGSVKSVSEELGIPYPEGRARLDEIIASLGFEVEDEEELSVSSDERRQILDELAKGNVTAEQALKKLRG